MSNQQPTYGGRQGEEGRVWEAERGRQGVGGRVWQAGCGRQAEGGRAREAERDRQSEGCRVKEAGRQERREGARADKHRVCSPLTCAQELGGEQAGKFVPLRGDTCLTCAGCSEPFPTHLPFSSYLQTPSRQSVRVDAGRDRLNLPGVELPNPMSACRAR